METLRGLLPSVNALVVFEAAGRLGSFTAAARELKMTQAAVSYAVARLEEQLGAALFLREYRRCRVSGSGGAGLCPCSPRLRCHQERPRKPRGGGNGTPTPPMRRKRAGVVV